MDTKMNNLELATELQTTAGIRLDDAVKFINVFTSTITKQLKKGNKVCTDLGNFYVKNKIARVGTNPRTHELINIKSGITVELKASKELKAAVQ